MWNFYKPPVPTVFKRAAQAARYTISGVTPSSWMSPLQPLPPYLPEQRPWQFDRAVGYNLFYKPRGTEKYSFEQLRYVSRHSELVRLAIETRMDQVSSIKWAIRPKSDSLGVDPADENDPRIKTISEFFAKPDKVHDWDQWVRIILEELFVVDAVSLAKRFQRDGGLFALEPVDGSTIFPLIDQDGRTPLPPDPAYQQILKGVPKANYSMDELIYYVRKAQVATPYGYSATEQVIETAYTDIERIKYTLAEFTEGTVPDAYITAPDGMSADKVLAYQEQLNDILSGNAAGRRRMPILVHGMEIKSMKQAELKNEFDEWMARKVCYAFSLPPTAFVRQLNRSTASSDQERAEDEGLFPVLLYLKRLIDRVIRDDFKSPDLEFYWDDDEEKDPKLQADIHAVYVDNAIMSVNEVRDELGLEPVEGGDEPMIKTAAGMVPLPGSPLDQVMQQQKQEQADAAAQQAHDNNLAITQAKGGAETAQAPKKKPTTKVVKKKVYADTTSTTNQHIH